MKRREFIAVLGTAAAWPLAARAEPDRMRRIGVLIATMDGQEMRARLAAFQQALQQLGWTDGRNLRIDCRWAEGNADQSRKYATELAALAPDTILAAGGSVVPSLQQATSTIPIVFTQTPDPVGAGFVDSLARPGGNVTGFMGLEYGAGAKWLELLKEIAPATNRVAVVRDPAVSAGLGFFGAIQAVAPSLGVELTPISMRDVGEIERSLAAFARSKWGLDRGRQRAGIRSQRSDLYAGGAAQIARGVLCTLLRHRRRPDVLWGRFYRSVPARGRLCRSRPPRREAGRPAGSGADQIRAGHQSEDCQGARPHGTGGAAHTRR